MAISSDSKSKKAQIVYPTEWGFKIIGRDREKLLAAIKKIMGDKEHLCYPGNPSRTGKFHSYNASCIVEDKKERDRLFRAFQEHSDIDIVI